MSLNTYKKSVIPEALDQVEKLKSDGVWFITHNMDFEDEEYRHIFEVLGGLQHYPSADETIQSLAAALWGEDAASAAPPRRRYGQGTVYRGHSLTDVFADLELIPDLSIRPTTAQKSFMFIEYTDGTTDQIATDANWTASTSPIVFDNVYAGETYDARREQPGWDTIGFDDSGWQAAEVKEWPTAKLRPQLLPPIRETKILTPIEIIDAGEGKWIVDLGQNITGWLHLTVDEAAGTEIRTRRSIFLPRRWNPSKKADIP